ncbi:MAG: DUF721 domain-containing protein, partial [Polyangiales bacterium]
MAQRRRRQATQPTSIGDLLAKTAIGLAAARIEVSHALWEDVAGQAFARRTKPERFAKGTLTVRVATSAWAQELALHAPLIVERLRARGVDIDRLRFQVGAVEPPDRSRPDPIPAAVLAPARLAEPPTDFVEGVLREITDPELAEAIVATARVVVRRVTEQALIETLRSARGRPKIKAHDEPPPPKQEVARAAATAVPRTPEDARVKSEATTVRRAPR